MSVRERAVIVAGAGLLDAAVGDPRRLHPVAGFGALAEALERLCWRPSRSTGFLYAALLVSGTGLAVALVESRLSARARIAFGSLCLWATLGGRSLANVACRLAGEVDRGELEQARETVRSLAGRDPSELDSEGLCRAAIESVAENTADAVLGPLVWFALAGSPGAAAYRAVNTLDAMVGHRSERYESFGWAAARLDDLASWPAARLGAALAVLLAPAAGGNRSQAWVVLRRDGSGHPSPNAGRLEAAFAGVLGVRLGGRLRYGTRSEERPLLGDGAAPTPANIRRAVQLSQFVCLCAGALACLACLLVRKR